MNVNGVGVRAELNVTPLVDVVLVLLIIFMVVTPLMRSAHGIELPKARSVQKASQRPGHVTLAITLGKTLMLGKREVKMELLGMEIRRLVAENPDTEVLVQGDKRLKFKEVKEVLDACHSAGVRRLALGARETTGS
jgi:biopolymer transport protein ExbD